VIVTDGLNDYISIASPANNSLSWTSSGIGNNSMTWEIWVNSTDTSGFYVSKPWNGNGVYNYYLQHSSLFFQVTQSNSISFTSLATGRWEHVAFVINSTQFAVYRNGVLNAGFSNHGISNNTVLAPGNVSLPLAVSTLYPYGIWAGNPSFSILGSSSIFRVYNRVLSANEILQNYDAVKGRFGY
jgi:hypothetical protein